MSFVNEAPDPESLDMTVKMIGDQIVTDLFRKPTGKVQ
jgi:hypothetical protein